MIAASSRVARRWRSTFRAVDRMLLLFMAALALVAAAVDSAPSVRILWLAGTSLAVVVSAVVRPHLGVARWVHDFLPLPAAVILFDLAGPLIGAANPTRWDGTFAAMDDRFFGPWVTAWFGALGRPPWLGDLASVFYVSYYVIPVAMAIALYARGRRAEFDEVIFALLATLFVTYVGYFLFPTTGPRVPEVQELAVLGGGMISAVVREFLRVAELNQLDAFPSGHTALSLVFLVFGWRLYPRWRLPLVVAVAGIIFATVYLSLHYVVDLWAGAIVAGAVLWAAPGLRRILGDQPPSLVATGDAAHP